MFSKLLQVTKVVALLGLLSSASTAAAQQYYDYYDGKRVEFHAATDKLVVKFANPETALRRTKALTGSRRLATVQDFELTSIPGVAFVNLQSSATKATISQALTALSQEADIISSSPVLLTESGQAVGAYTDEVIVALKSANAKAAMLASAERLGAKLVRRYEFDAQTFILSVDKAKGTALTVANQLAESGLVKYAQPNYLLYVDKTTSDPFYSQQWAIENTGNNSSPTGVAGADMKVYQAWQATYWHSGNGIKIAVVDEGVDLTHPDLAAALNPGFDATGGGTNGGSVGNSAHGTACAGEIVAIPNNNIGITGVAYNSKVVPVRVLTPGSLTTDLTVATYCASGLDWAWQNNRSDIISCSWRTAVGQNLIADAIRRAVSNGRNYSGTPLGCVVLFATGNENTNGISFPASMSEVVAVGASSMCDQRKSPSSCDGENWGSNYGAGLDVVAPGVKVYTTDIQGSAGYNATSGTGGDYISNFNGTSSATPYAAAVTSLILGSNSSLTQAQARGILEASANKVGGYSYNTGAGERADLSWNVEMGYGRINAYDAVIRARQSCTAGGVAGPTALCSNSGTYTVQSPPNGTTFTWSSSDPSVATIDATTGVATGVGTGSVTFTASGVSPCGWDVSVSKQVEVGGPQGTYVQETSQDPCVAMVFMTVPNWNPAYTYTVKGSGITAIPATLTSPNFRLKSGSGAQGRTFGYTVTVTGCNNMEVWSDYVTIGQCGGPTPYREAAAAPVMAYPNPVAESLTLPEGVVEATLLNSQGRAVQKADMSGHLNTQELPDGLYNLQMYKDGQLINQRIQVKH